jgi:MFS family permease
MFVIGTFSGRAFDAGYFRPVVVAGMVVQLVGIFTMSLATNYWQLLLSHGVCTGVGGGIFFIPIMSVVSTYFAKRRGLAIGLVTTGNSIGGIVYPTIVRQLLDQVGYGWSVRVLGFINAAAFCIVLVFMKPRLPPRKSGPLLDPNTLHDKPYLLHVLGVTFLMPPVYFVYYYVRVYSKLAP